MPFAVWLALLRHAAGWTGYTHQWRTCEQAYRAILMASVDSTAEQQLARSMGWRTFRVRSSNGDLVDHEITCPASIEAGHVATCESCGLCRGLARSAKSIAITVHGSRVKWFTVNTQGPASER